MLPVFLISLFLILLSSSAEEVHKKNLKAEKKIAIIGASGYIGSALFKYLNSRYEAFGYDRNPLISITEKAREIIKMKSSEIPENILHSFNTIIYLGGLTTTKMCLEHPELVIQENVRDPLSLVKRMKKDQIFIFASTSSITEGSSYKNATEEWSVQEGLLDTLSSSMYEREKELRKIASDSKLLDKPKLIGLRFGEVVGISESQRVDNLLTSFMKSAYSTGYIEVRESLKYMSFLGLNDLVRAVDKIISSDFNRMNAFDIFHLKSTNDPIEGIANEIAMQTGATTIGTTTSTSLGFSLSSSKFEKQFSFEFTETKASLVKLLKETIPQSITAKGIHKTPDLYTRCPVCGAMHHQLVLDLDQHTTGYNINKETNSSQFPVKVARCYKCNHLFLVGKINRDSSLAKYINFSQIKNPHNHFKSLLQDIDNDFSSIKNRSRTILEIGSNDGARLDHLKAMKWDTYGIESVPNMVSISVAKGHKVEAGIWGEKTFQHIPPPYKLDVIMAINIFTHVTDPIKFLTACAKIMGPNTKLYVQSSQCQLYKNETFPSILYGQVSIFTGHSLAYAANLSRLEITDFKVIKESCITTFMLPKLIDKKLDKKNINHRTSMTRIQKRLLREKSAGITEEFFYVKYEARALFTRQWITKQLNALKTSNYLIGAYGADATSLASLYFLLGFDFNKKKEKLWKFSFLLDETSTNPNEFVPGTDIKLKPISFLSSLPIHQPIAIVILSLEFWENIAKDIGKAMILHKDKIIIIFAFPNTRIVKLNVSAQSVNSKFISPVLDIPYKPSQWPIIATNRRRRNVTLTSHFYNEEFILPFWIRQHSSMFDRVILFDYFSNDSSRRILAQTAPSSWIVTTTETKFFDSDETDREIIKWERKYPDDWKISSTMMEFFVNSDLRSSLNSIKVRHGEKVAIKLPAVSIIGNDSDSLRPYASLPSQRHVYGVSRIPEKLMSIFAKNFFDNHYARVFHTGFTGGDYSYEPGRHLFYYANKTACTRVWKDLPPLVIMKFIWSPWPQIALRKKQIGSKIGPVDRSRGSGVQHVKLINKDVFDERRDILKGVDPFDLNKIVDSEDISFDAVTAYHNAVVPESPIY